MRTILYGPDGTTPIAYAAAADGNPEPHGVDKALLVEFFGTLMGYQQEHEWPKMQGGLQEAVGRMLDLIVDRVGPEVVNARFRKYGCRIALVPNTDTPAPPLEQVPPDAPKGPPVNPYRDLNKDKLLTFPKAVE